VIVLTPSQRGLVELFPDTAGLASYPTVASREISQHGVREKAVSPRRQRVTGSPNPPLLQPNPQCRNPTWEEI